MKETTLIACIAALMVILIALVLVIFALDSPQREIPMGSEPPGAMGGGGQVNQSGGHGEGNPVTNQNDTYVACKKDVCNVTVIPWVTPTLAYHDYAVYYAGGGGGAPGHMAAYQNYTIIVGSGGGAGSYNSGAK